MKYEKPELVVLPPAIEAVQIAKVSGTGDPHDSSPAYEDWE